MTVSTRQLPGPVARVLGGCVALVESVAFWVAAGLPVAYPPLLAALQYAVLDPTAVVGVAVANLLALLVGHRHEPTRFGRDRPRRRPHD